MPDVFRRFSRALERRLTSTGLIVIAGLVFVASVSAAAVQARNDAHRTATTTSSIPPSSTPARMGIPGFGPVQFSIGAAEQAAPRSFCGLLAETSEQMARGLMERRDLGGYDGMIFRFPNDTSAAFYMANVPISLSVAWFDASGHFVSAADMPPCTVEPKQCPLFHAAGRYRYALEVPEGGLGALGVGAGSTLAVGGSSCA